MKKIYTLLLLVMASVTFGQTILSENFGTPTANTLIPAYATGTPPATFQSVAPIVFSGTASIRSTAASTGYTGASGGGNGYLATGAGNPYIQISGLNTLPYPTSGIQFTFGYWTFNVPTTQMVLEYSTDGATWTNIPFLNNTVAGWNLVTIPTGTLPSSSTLSIRFTQPGTTDQFRIDDVKIIYINPSCTFALGTPATVCDATTYALDTYSASIPYTGGGNGTYTVTSTTGTVSGDNPSTVANGTITVTGITEGTSISIHATGVTCDWTLPIPARDCKPINTLPYTETFPYAGGDALGGTQKWANISTGDDITVFSPGLTYPGFPSANNAVSFSGSGNDCITPFTDTTSGVIYGSFLMQVTSTTNVTTYPANAYFAAFTKATPSYQARLFISTTSATQYEIGLDANSNTTTNYDTTLRNVGDVLLVIMSYDFGTNTLKAWINPTNLATFSTAAPTLTSVATTPIADLGGFVLRQDQFNTTPTMLIDELRIFTNPAQLLAANSFTSQITGLKLYPNPVTNGTLYIDSTTNTTKAIVLYDLLGKEVLHTTTESNSINLSGVTSGLYVIKVTEEGTTYTNKLIIK